MKTITLSDEMLNIIAQALGELPFKISAPVFNCINDQLSKQPDMAVTQPKDSVFKD
jgi:hypothetical protein